MHKYYAYVVEIMWKSPKICSNWGFFLKKPLHYRKIYAKPSAIWYLSSFAAEKSDKNEPSQTLSLWDGFYFNVLFCILY